MKENDFHGPTMSVSAMCASANAAMITAKSWLDTGIASDVILLATDLCGVPQLLRPFSDLGAAILDMPPLDACRPFQEGSRGFVGGEAAVAMVLSKRAPVAYASVLGGAMTMDAHPTWSAWPRISASCSAASAWRWPTPAPIRRTWPTSTPTDRAPAGATRPRRPILDELFPDAARDLLGQAAGRPLPVGGGRRGDCWPPSTPSRPGSCPAPPQVAPGHPKLVDGRSPGCPA